MLDSMADACPPSGVSYESSDPVSSRGGKGGGGTSGGAPINSRGRKDHADIPMDQRFREERRGKNWQVRTLLLDNYTFLSLN